MTYTNPTDIHTDQHSGHYRIWLTQAPLWVRAWWKAHRVARLAGLRIVPSPLKWLERRGYADELPW